MNLVIIHSWQDDANAASAVSEVLGILLYEARQKIVGGGPVMIKSFADGYEAEQTAKNVSNHGLANFVLDVELLRRTQTPFKVARFVWQEQLLYVENAQGERHSIDDSKIDLLIAAIGSSGRIEITDTVTERKFSVGRTLMMGGIPMTKKVSHNETRSVEERNETLWLYGANIPPLLFDLASMKYDGLGADLQPSRTANFATLKKTLRKRSPQAIYDERLLRRAAQVHLLGRTIDPETNLDLSCAILAKSLLA